MEPDKITVNSALNFTWGTNLAAIIATIGAAVLALIGTLGDLPPIVIVGALATVGVGLLAAAIAAAADVLARAWVTAAKERSGSSDEDGSNAPTQEIVQTRPLSATGVPFAVQVGRLSPEPVRVLALRWDKKASKIEYLVGESGAGLVWIPEDEAQGVTFPT